MYPHSSLKWCISREAVEPPGLLHVQSFGQDAYGMHDMSLGGHLYLPLTRLAITYHIVGMCIRYLTEQTGTYLL